MRKVLYNVLPVLMVALVMFVGFAPMVLADNGVSTDWPAQGNRIETVTGLAGDVWSTVLTIAQILAFAAVVFAGVRYMFASADQKADIKKGMIYLVIGAILVFGASTVVKLIMKITDQAVGDKAVNTEIVSEIA